MHQQWHHQEHQLTVTNNQQRPQQPARFSYSLLPTNHIHHTIMDTGQMINPNFSYPFHSDYHSWRELPAFCEDWMTGSGRKRISKWDLKEAPHLLPGEHNDAGPGRTSNNEPQPRWRYGEGNYKEGRESLNASDFWDGDTTYGTKMSPGLDEWRQQKRNRSPESGRGRSYRSRSKSRSPERGFKRAGSNDSIGVQPCKDFVAGRCRRGDLCPHIHQDYEFSEDRKYLGSGLTDSWEGRHRRIDASKYFTSDDTRERTPRTGRSNDFSRRSANEVSRERESDRRDRVTSFEHNRTHESRRSGDIVCKFFAAGNCRNGKFCRFSHHGQTQDSFDNKPRSDWRQGVNSLDRMDSLKEGSRWSGTAVSDFANFSKWNEDRSGGIGIPEQSSISRSVDGSLATDYRFMVHRMDNDTAIENSERGYLQLTADNTGSGIGVSESSDTDIRVADMEISPAWDYRLPSSNHIVKEESLHTTEPSKFSLQDEVALQTFQQDIIRDVNQKHQTVAFMQPLISQTSYFQQNPSLDNDALNRFSCENRNTIRDGTLPHIDLNFSAYVPPREGVDQNGQGSTTVTHPHSCLNAIDKNQQIFAPYTTKDKSFTYIGNPPPPQEGTSSKPDVLDTIKSDVISDNPLTRSIVSSEQFSNLTVSLARLLESGKQLPELYASLNGSNSMGFTQLSLSNSAGPAAFPAPVSSQPKSAVGSQKQYDPVSGSMELTTVSLARLLESGKQLPELYAALNGSNSMGFTQSSLSNSAGPAAFPAPVSSQPKSAVGSQKQYDPVSGSMELTTVSLARLLESGKQLPELYAALNGSNSMGFTQSSLSNSASPAAFPAPVSSQPKSAVGSQKQNDPVIGSMELTTVSLARLLESGKQLPELFAALNGSNSMGFTQSSLSNSAGPSAFPAPVSSQPNSAVGSQKQYGPVSGSMELTKSEISNLPGEVVPNSSENKRFLGEKPEIQAQLPPFFPGGPSGVDLYRTDSISADLNTNIHQLSREDQNGNNKGMENNTMTVEERNKGQDNGVMGKIEGDGRADEDKKNNDGKGIRAFKFALAEFVKELLKPTWKEGQINKEAHKTIVKKVVDKVTGTIQGGHIPQSQEKIDSYLSSSKPKLSKLVQAYVEKIQKEKPAVT